MTGEIDFAEAVSGVVVVAGGLMPLGFSGAVVLTAGGVAVAEGIHRWSLAKLIILTILLQRFAVINKSV